MNRLEFAILACLLVRERSLSELQQLLYYASESVTIRHLNALAGRGMVHSYDPACEPYLTKPGRTMQADLDAEGSSAVRQDGSIEDSPALCSSSPVQGAQALHECNSIYRITDVGRQRAIQVIAEEMSWERQALLPLNASETIVLKNLLWRMMQATDKQSIPSPWD